MKTKKTYKELTIDEWQQRLRDGGADSLGKLAVADTFGRSPVVPEWRITTAKLKKITITPEGQVFHLGENSIPWRCLALVEEEAVWEVGDTVEVIADEQWAPNTCIYLRAGAKGMVVQEAEEGGRIKVKQTSPKPFEDGQWYTYSDNLRPWAPGYGYMPDGNRVPPVPDWEECNKKRDAGKELTPLEYFIYEHTPCLRVDEEEFHLDLGEAVKFLTEERVVGKD